ncbi:MAG TPA: acetylglutamate kinase [Rhizobiales bacterium]|nr:acetylglutamate kinase [bacterium BMS3Bbin10]HDO51496.1 acetylglutamate kinase [Hyphomicrobiales bacterium]
MPKDNAKTPEPAGATPPEAAILSKALPFMQRYDGATVVVKYGGNAMGDADLATSFARDIVLLKQSGVNPVVVHGGGPQIGALLDKLGIKSEFKGGLRVTDQDTMDVVEMVLAGSINKRIVAAINAQGGKAVGISGKDAGLMTVRKLEKQIPDPDSDLMKMVDLGFVGEPAEVDPHIIDVIIASDLIPVVAPLGVSREGNTYNVNADTFAGALAARMQAKRLLLLTDVEGVLDANGKLVPALTVKDAAALIEDGTIDGGMIPKIESCMSVVRNGVEAVVIINGKTPHAVLLELFTEHGAGTLLHRADDDSAGV